MRVIQDDTFAAVVVPDEEANSSGKSLPTPAEASGPTLEPAEVSTQVRVQALYRVGLLLLSSFEKQCESYHQATTVPDIQPERQPERQSNSGWLVAIGNPSTNCCIAIQLRSFITQQPTIRRVSRATAITMYASLFFTYVCE